MLFIEYPEFPFLSMIIIEINMVTNSSGNKLFLKINLSLYLKISESVPTQLGVSIVHAVLYHFSQFSVPAIGSNGGSSRSSI